MQIFKSIVLVVLVTLVTSTASAFSPEGSPIKTRIDRVLAEIQRKTLDTDQYTPWTVMHGVITLGKASTVFDVDLGENVSSINYLLTKASYGGGAIFVEKEGLPVLRSAPFDLSRSVCQQFYQIQDHPDQYLMAFSEAGVSLQSVVLADTGKKFQIADLLLSSQRDFDPTRELGWTLAAYSEYLPDEHKWQSSDGESYTIEKILNIAIARDLQHLVEGGTHHIYGIAKAYQRFKKELSEKTQQEVEMFLRGYTIRAERFQSYDGAFSEKFFSRKVRPKIAKDQAIATGHMLEWLAVFLNEDELREEWVVRSVDFLCRLIRYNSTDNFSVPGLYHVGHALQLYRDKVFPE